MGTIKRFLCVALLLSAASVVNAQNELTSYVVLCSQTWQESAGAVTCNSADLVQIKAADLHGLQHHTHSWSLEPDEFESMYQGIIAIFVAALIGRLMVRAIITG